MSLTEHFGGLFFSKVILCDEGSQGLANDSSQAKSGLPPFLYNPELSMVLYFQMMGGKSKG